ncbi:MAG: hypothetical protein K2L16_10260 [Muribaculaceae bacterium]|nr:hypothetical protein [Muribaculaceae bacterium]
MKVLLLGDASNYHNSLAQGLRKLGHTVCVASDGSRWMKTDRDIDLTRPFRGPAGGALLYGRMLTMLASKLSGYDVVQLVSPSFVQLRPSRLLKLLHRLKKQNGMVWLSALGTDSNFVRALTSPNPPLEYSEWQIGGRITAWSDTPEARKAEWLAQELSDYTDEFYGLIDGAVSALYEYHKVLETTHPSLNLHYGGIPVCLDALPEPDLTPRDTLNLMYTAHRGREGEKGSLYLLDMLRRLEREFVGKVRLSTPANVPYRDFLELLRGADIVSDQLYSYTPGTTALLAMALGAASISGGEEDFYRFIGEDTLRPIINPDPLDLEASYDNLRQLVADCDRLMELRRDGRRFVARHNESSVVASRFVDAWQKS